MMNIKQRLKKLYKKIRRRPLWPLWAALILLAIILVIVGVYRYGHPSEEEEDGPFSYDRKAPVIHLKQIEFWAAEGQTLVPEDFVEYVEDETAVTLSFATGSDHTFEKTGTEELTILAVDAAGNKTKETVTVTVTVQDITKPVISGTDDILLHQGDNFDLMEGVAAEDDMDGSIEVTADRKALNTNSGGCAQITYTATDRAGNTQRAIRYIMIASETITYEGEEYPIYWDTSAVGDHPYLIAVNRIQNTVTVYRQDEEGNYTIPDRAFVCSVGDNTPTGYYLTEERYRWQGLYDNAWGQYATRIVDHILFHSVPYYSEEPDDLEYEEYNMLGSHASLGCVRLSVADAKWIYDNTEEGFPCVIYDDSLVDGPLGKPIPITIDVNDAEKRGWDPTDPDEDNPWNEETGD